MKKILLIMLVLFMFAGCSTNNSQDVVEEQPKEEVVEEQPKEEEIIEEDKAPLTDDGDIIFLHNPKNQTKLIGVCAGMWDVDLDYYSYGKGNYDAEGSDEGFYHFISVSYNNDYGYSFLEFMVNKDELCSPNRFLMGAVELAEHDNEEYDGQTVYDWILAHKDDGDAETKFGDANFHIYDSSNGDMYILDVYTDGNDWWQYKLLQEME